MDSRYPKNPDVLYNTLTSVWLGHIRTMCGCQCYYKPCSRIMCNIVIVHFVDD